MSYEDSLRVIEGVNNVIKNSGIDTNKVSDGYHTFGELYEHRVELFITLCRVLGYIQEYDVFIWKSKLHHDGTSFDGWFIMGIGDRSGFQISYHLPLSKWDDCAFVTEHEKAPDWDGHTSSDVLERLKQL